MQTLGSNPRWIYRHSLGDCDCSKLYLSSCLSVCLSDCPALTAYISMTIIRTLLELGGSVGTWVQLVISKFHEIGSVMTLF